MRKDKSNYCKRVPPIVMARPPGPREARPEDKSDPATHMRRKRIELIHAQYKNRGFGILRVRGLVRARAIALWHALAHNLLTVYRLRGSLA